MGGRFGPLSVHTPDICYGASGYVVQGSQKPFEIKTADGSVARFWTARFVKPGAADAPSLRIYWSWNPGDSWQAPANPRWTFRMKPVLYKLYVTTRDEAAEADVAVAFLRDWLPRLDQALFDQPK
jgi:hypothetical protein